MVYHEHPKLQILLERSWNGLETVFGTVLERSLERSWNGLGTVLERSWNVVGTVFETVLERYLERSWNGLGTVQPYMNVALCSLLYALSKKCT